MFYFFVPYQFPSIFYLPSQHQFLKKMDLADRKLELDRQLHVDKVDAEKEDRRLREIDMVKRNKTLSDMMMQKMCDLGNSSSK